MTLASKPEAFGRRICALRPVLHVLSVATCCPGQTYSRAAGRLVGTSPLERTGPTFAVSPQGGRFSFPTCPGAPAGVEGVRRGGSDASWLFLLNHADAPHTVAARGVDLLTGACIDGTVTLPAGGVAVVREL